MAFLRALASRPKDTTLPSCVASDDFFFDVGEVQYVAWSTSLMLPACESEEDGFVITEPLREGFVTVIRWDQEGAIGAELLQRNIKRWTEADDVFQAAFLEQVVFASTRGSKLKILPEARDLLKSYGTTGICFQAASRAPPNGPYVMNSQKLLQIRRLYDDSQRVFLTTFKQSSTKQGEYGVLTEGKRRWDCCSAALPSRLAATPSPEKPFDGCRIALKDAFDLQGVRTSMCNRAYLDLYPAATSTAPCLKGIVDGGAEILGKTKLSMFLSREEPSESVDFQTAWNPQGDGYQGPGGSSSGSAAAVGAYYWVDIGIGSDTNGSIRRPGQCNGCFGLRPSRGALSSDGMFTVFK